jgi:hypothetical protein
VIIRIAGFISIRIHSASQVDLDGFPHQLRARPPLPFRNEIEHVELLDTQIAVKRNFSTAAQCHVNPLDNLHGYPQSGSK